MYALLLVTVVLGGGTYFLYKYLFNNESESLSSNYTSNNSLKLNSNKEENEGKKR